MRVLKSVKKVIMNFWKLEGTNSKADKMMFVRSYKIHRHGIVSSYKTVLA